jgi:hypothetical protein
MGPDVWCYVARNRNPLPPRLMAVTVAEDAAIHAHLEAGNMGQPPLACPNRFSWLMMMMHALRTTIGGLGSSDWWAFLRVGGRRMGGHGLLDRGLYGPTTRLGSTVVVARERVRVRVQDVQARLWIAGFPRRQHRHPGLVKAGA